MHEPLDLPFSISPSVSALVVHMTEGKENYLELVGWYPEESRLELIRFTFERFLGVRMESMIGEAGTGIGLCRADRSQWLRKLNAAERNPSFRDNFANVKHYYFSGHDMSVEVLAEGFSWTTIRRLDDW